MHAQTPIPHRLQPAGRATALAAALALFVACGCDVSPPAAGTLEFNVAEPPTALAAAGPPVFEAGAVFYSIPGKLGSHAPALTTLPDGGLLAAWYSYDGPEELDGAAIYLSRRPAHDAADSAAPADWTPPQVLIARAEAVGNPVLYREGARVWLFYAIVAGGWSTARVEFIVSDDAGATWADPRSIYGPLGTNVRFPPLRLTSGERLLPAYDDLLQRALFFASDDGVDWSLRAVVATAAPHRCIQPSIAELESGRMLAVMRNTGAGRMWVSASDDAGETWLAPRSAGFSNPASPASLTRLADGTLLLVFNDSQTLRRPLSATISADDGRTWVPPRVLVDGDGEFAYPAVVQTLDGVVHVLYSHDRAFIGHVRVNAAWLAGE